MKKVMEIIKKPVALYHSGDDNYGKGLRPIGVFFIVLSLFFGIFVCIDFFNIGNKALEPQYRYLYRYLFGESLGLCFFSFITHKYIYSEKDSKIWRVISIVIYYAILVVVILSLIPVFIIVAIEGKITSYRAKKTENLQSVWLIFVVDILIVGAIGWVEIQTGFIEWTVNILCAYVKLNIIATELFIFFSAAEILILIFNKLILMSIYGTRKRSQKKKVDIINEKSLSGFKSGEDIAAFSQRKNKKINEFLEKDKNDIDYDIKYHKKTLLKMQVLSLVAIGFIAIFSASELVKDINTDLINVVTCFSLIILYIDKRETFGKIEE